MKKLLILIIILALGAAGYTSWQYHEQSGKWPWASKADLKAWASFTKAEGTELGNTVKTTAVSTAKQGWKWTTENTSRLYDKSKDLLAKLGHQDEGAAAAGDEAGAAGAGGPPAPEPPKDPLEQKSQSYKYGKEWLRKGIAEWQVGLVHPGAAKRAKDHLERAIATLKEAKTELGGDATVDDYLLEARAYLADTEQMLVKIEAAEKQAEK